MGFLDQFVGLPGSAGRNFSTIGTYEAAQIMGKYITETFPDAPHTEVAFANGRRANVALRVGTISGETALLLGAAHYPTRPNMPNSEQLVVERHRHPASAYGACAADRCAGFVLRVADTDSGRAFDIYNQSPIQAGTRAYPGREAPSSVIGNADMTNTFTRLAAAEASANPADPAQGKPALEVLHAMKNEGGGLQPLGQDPALGTAVSQLHWGGYPFSVEIGGQAYRYEQPEAGAPVAAIVVPELARP